MVFQPRRADEEQNQNDDEPLFRLSENKQIQEAFHRCA
jgi:hypothetical protein